MMEKRKRKIKIVRLISILFLFLAFILKKS
jgi:hypothetical protein